LVVELDVLVSLGVVTVVVVVVVVVVAAAAVATDAVTLPA
jgi:hypothetical protein